MHTRGHLFKEWTDWKEINNQWNIKFKKIIILSWRCHNDEMHFLLLFWPFCILLHMNIYPTVIQEKKVSIFHLFCLTAHSHISSSLKPLSVSSSEALVYMKSSNSLAFFWLIHFRGSRVPFLGRRSLIKFPKAKVLFSIGNLSGEGILSLTFLGPVSH